MLELTWKDITVNELCITQKVIDALELDISYDNDVFFKDVYSVIHDRLALEESKS